MKLPVRIRTNMSIASPFGCHFLLHVGRLAIYIGRKSGFGRRLEILTPFHKWRYSNTTIRIKYRGRW